MVVEQIHSFVELIKKEIIQIHNCADQFVLTVKLFEPISEAKEAFFFYRKVSFIIFQIKFRKII